MFETHYDLSRAKPASYNPRQIDPESVEALKHSINTMGLIKPIIVTKEGLILAGHQRSTVMRSIGITHCPAFVISETNQTDEVRFNQLHNGSDIEFADAAVTITPRYGFAGQFVTILPEDITAGKTERFAAKKAEMLRLLTKYGPWGSVIATEIGEVLVSGLYASCCRQIRSACLAYIVRDDQASAVKDCFGRQYGRFSYGHLPKTTWGQTLAQKRRLRNQETGIGKSRTYENLVLPILRKEMRILDFGAGQMDYVQDLKAKGFDIRGIEFYFRSGAKINESAVHRDISAVCDDIAANGLYDLVVCDSVLNSVDSVQAEQDVINCVLAFCRPGTGIAVMSGRLREKAEHNELHRGTMSEVDVCRVSFFDENGLTAHFGNGVWLYQMHHYEHQVRTIATANLMEPIKIINNEGRDLTGVNACSATGWGIRGLAPAQYDLPRYLPSLRREFDLPLPDGRSYQRSDDIEAAIRAASSKYTFPNR